MPLSYNHQVGLVVAVNGLLIKVLWQSRQNEIQVATIALLVGIVCFNMETLDRYQWMDSQVLILGICVPFILIIGISIMLLYRRVIAKMKLLHRLKKHS